MFVKCSQGLKIKLEQYFGYKIKFLNNWSGKMLAYTKDIDIKFMIKKCESL